MSQDLPSLEQVAAEFHKAKAETPKAEAPKVDVAKAEPAPAAEPEAAPQAAAEEAAPKSEKAPEPKRDPVSKQFAALSRQEKELRQMKADLERRMAEMENREKSLKQRDEEWESNRKSPYKVLKTLGYTAQDVINDATGMFTPPAEDPVDSRFKTMEETQAKLAKENQELRERLEQKLAADSEAEYERAIRIVEETIDDTFSAAPEKYELSLQFGAEARELAKEVMREYHKEYDKLLDYSEACDIVEKHYEDEVLSRLSSTKKAQSRLGAKESKAPAKQVPSKEASKPITTLSNSASDAAQAKVDLDKLPKEDVLSVLARQLKFHS